MKVGQLDINPEQWKGKSEKQFTDHYLKFIKENTSLMARKTDEEKVEYLKGYYKIVVGDNAATAVKGKDDKGGK